MMSWQKHKNPQNDTDISIFLPFLYTKNKNIIDCWHPHHWWYTFFFFSYFKFKFKWWMSYTTVKSIFQHSSFHHLLLSMSSFIFRFFFSGKKILCCHCHIIVDTIWYQSLWIWWNLCIFFFKLSKTHNSIMFNVRSLFDIEHFSYNIIVIAALQIHIFFCLR